MVIFASSQRQALRASTTTEPGEKQMMHVFRAGALVCLMSIMFSSHAWAQCTNYNRSNFNTYVYDDADPAAVNGLVPPSSDSDTGDMWFRHPLDSTLIADLNTALANGCTAQIVYEREGRLGALSGLAQAGWDFDIGTWVNTAGSGIVMMDAWNDVEDYSTLSWPYVEDDAFTVPITSYEMGLVATGDFFAVRAVGYVWADAVGTSGGDGTDARYWIHQSGDAVHIEYWTP